MAKTFADIKAYARARANMENSDFIGTTEEGYVINDAYRDLYNKLVTSYERYYVTDPVDFTLTTDNYTTVASDFFKLVGVERKYGNKYQKLNPFNFANRNDANTASTYVGGTSTVDDQYGYSLAGRKLYIKPLYEGEYRYWYVPDITELVNDADLLDVECERFWKYIALTAAMEYLTDEESDTSQVERQLAREEANLERYMANRQQEQLTIANVEPVVRNTTGYYGDGIYFV